MRTSFTHELRTTSLFLPPALVRGDDPDLYPIERATNLESNVRLVMRNRAETNGRAPRVQLDWSVADLERAIDMLAFIRDTLTGGRRASPLLTAARRAQEFLASMPEAVALADELRKAIEGEEGTP